MGDGLQTSGGSKCRVIRIKTTTRVSRSWPRMPATGAGATIPTKTGALSATASVKNAAAIPTTYMNNDFTIGRINFGPRDSFTTLGQLIDEIGAQEELVDDLFLYIGELLTKIELLKECLPPVTESYEL